MAIDTSNNYSNNINDTASGAYASIVDSITHSKNNPITLDKMCEWYLFEDTVLMPMPFLNKYKHVLYNNSILVDIGKDYYYRPEYVSYKLYNTTDLWYLLLFLNQMKSVEEFNKPTIRALNPNKISVLKKIISSENVTYTRDNPRHIYKQYIKNPGLPSDQLLPDEQGYDIINNGISDLREQDIDNLAFANNLYDYYFKGKSNMELFKIVDGVRLNTDEYRYMDGIRIDNMNSGASYDTKYSGYERKFTGYINLSKIRNKNIKDLIDIDGNYKGYQFQINGINGSAYLIINNTYMYSEFSNTNKLNLNSTIKEYDYFERYTRNSDFKQRNTVGWNRAKDPNSDKNKYMGRVSTDAKLKKPVYIADINKFTGDLITGKLTAKNLDSKLEPLPLTDKSNGEIMYTCNFRAINIKNAKVLPFMEIVYKSGKKDREYAFEEDWELFTNMEEYQSVFILSNLDRNEVIDYINVGIEIQPTIDIIDMVGGEVRLDEININRITKNTMYNSDLVIGDVDWVPYTVVYKHNGNGAAMFNLTWKPPGSSNFEPIPRDCIAILPDHRDVKNIPESMKSCMLVTAKGKINGIDQTYLEILTARAEAKIQTKPGHYELVYHLNISLGPDDKIYIKNINKNNTNFKVRINKNIITKFDKDENNTKFTPLKYVDDINLNIIRMLGGNISVDIEIIDNTVYDNNEIVQYSIKTDRTGILDYFKEEEISIIPEKLNTVNKDKNGAYNIEMLKNSLLEVNLLNSNSEVLINEDQYLIEFDITVNSPDKGLFILNLDKQFDNDRDKFMLVFEYTGHSIADNIEYPEYKLNTGCYKVNENNPDIIISNIDVGIDFYKYPYEVLRMYRNNLPFDDKLNIEKLKLYRGQSTHLFVRKNRSSIVLGINNGEEDIIVASWIDENWEDLVGGITTMQFMNITNVKISNLKVSM